MPTCMSNLITLKQNEVHAMPLRSILSQYGMLKLTINNFSQVKLESMNLRLETVSMMRYFHNPRLSNLPNQNLNLI